jgi:hypothetical protein
MASSPGHAGRPNEDFVGAVPGAVVLLDGAGIPDTEEICHHGVAWHSHTLGASLLARLATDGVTDLVAALADSIDHVAGLHRHSCDIADPSSPQSTVAIARFAEDCADFLVLADSYVVLDAADAEPQVVTDPRELAVRGECTAPLRGLVAGTPDYENALPGVIDALRARRNQPGGYWIAKDDPEAAVQALAGSVPLDGLFGAAVLSNGASRIVHPYRLANWAAVMELMRTNGPDEVLRLVRDGEGGRTAQPDDASAAYVTL